jgi:acylphosphatase
VTEKREQLHAIVQGRVQGVNYRYYTQRRAEELGVTGWVRNREDRTVEVTAEGTRAQLDDLLTFLRQGPPSARVTDVDVEWKQASGRFGEFSVTG